MVFNIITNKVCMLITIEVLEGGTTLTCTDQRP